MAAVSVVIRVEGFVPMASSMRESSGSVEVWSESRADLA